MSSSELIPANQFQTVVPSNDGTLTVRTLNTSSPINNSLLSTYQIHTSIPPIPITSGLCLQALDTQYLIDSREKLFSALCEVMIRFDTNPNFYQKEDYSALLRLLVRSLGYIYNSPNVSVAPTPYKIVTSPKVLANAIPAKYLVKTLTLYNNEDFDVTASLGTGVETNDLFYEEVIGSKSWLTLALNKVYSLTSDTSVNFTCSETLTSSGLYLILEIINYANI